MARYVLRGGLEANTYLYPRMVPPLPENHQALERLVAPERVAEYLAENALYAERIANTSWTGVDAAFDLCATYLERAARAGRTRVSHPGA